MSDQSRRTLRLLPDKPSPTPHAPVPSHPSPLRGYRMMALGSNAAARAPSPADPADPPAPQPKRLEATTQFLSTDALFARRQMLPPGPYVPVDPVPVAPPAGDTPGPARREANDLPSRARRILLTVTVTLAAAAALAAVVVLLFVRPGAFLQTVAKPTAAQAVPARKGAPSPPPAPDPAPKEDARATPPPKVTPIAIADRSPPVKSNGSRTPQRAASDALAAGDFEAALDLYRELARSNPGHTAYEKAAQVLERRVSAGAARSGTAR